MAVSAFYAVLSVFTVLAVSSVLSVIDRHWQVLGKDQCITDYSTVFDYRKNVGDIVFVLKGCYNAL